MTIRIGKSNERESIEAQVFVTPRCPHSQCGVRATLSPVSFPHYDLLRRFRPISVGIVFRCDSCNNPIFGRLKGEYEVSNNIYNIDEKSFEEIERPLEAFETELLPPDVASDLIEALTCYQHKCWNAFAAMVRRTLQSVAEALGVEGKTKVQQQVKSLAEEIDLDEESRDLLEQLVRDSGDGAHPHLPTVDEERAIILLAMAKDALDQLFLRAERIRKAKEKRQEAIDRSRGKESEGKS